MKFIIFMILLFFIVSLISLMIKSTITDKDRNFYQIWLCVAQIINLILFIIAYWWYE